MKNLFLLLLSFTATTLFAQAFDSSVQPTITDSLYAKAEEMPSFPGGQSAMYSFVQKNLVYPQVEKEASIQGTCYVNFIVEKDGKITNVTITKGVDKGPGCDAECIRLANSMPHWIPGKQNGKTVRVNFNMPIKFLLR